MRATLLALLILLAGCADAGAPEGIDDGTEPPDGAPESPPALPATAWERLEDAAVPRAEHWAAAVDGKVYVIGGYLIGTPAWSVQPTTPVAGGPFAQTALVEVYDTATDTWSHGVDYPGPVDHHPTIAYDGVIYVFKEPMGEAAGSYYSFDPDVGAWEPFPPAPNSHHAGTVGVIGDRIYLAGNTDTVDVFDPRNGTWETFPADGELPTVRNHASGGALHGALYLIAGDTAGHAVNTDANEAFHAHNGTWTPRTPIPVVRGSTAGAVWHERIVLIGGQSGEEGEPAYADVDAYDPASDTWTKLPDLPVGRHGAAAAVVDDALYVFGGAPRQGIYGFAQTHVLRPA